MIEDLAFILVYVIGINDDGYNLVILDRKTLEPLYALEYGRFGE